MKNKVAIPWRTAHIDLIYGVGYDFSGEVVDLGVELGLIEQAGAWFKYEENKYQGKDSLSAAFIEDQGMYTALRSKVRTVMGLENE